MKARDFSELQINVQPLGVRGVEFPDDISNSLKNMLIIGVIRKDLVTYRATFGTICHSIHDCLDNRICYL